ncbi:hypothetical protein GGF39_003441 [Coemansia sp. RSA 1721]|nr:hypothetical protein GGF39_003441 [Coemansia sp. RSA 1721]
MSDLLFARSIPIGPENPSEMGAILNAKQKDKLHIFIAVTHTSSVLSGLMVVFLASAFIWRRSIVNRVSLRLIFTMSLFDFIQSIFSYKNLSTHATVTYRTYTFFVDFMTASSCYMSSSIAFNMQMIFLRKNKKPLPKYTEFLYFAVPMTVAFLQYFPQAIWSAKNGFCTSFDPVQLGTARYIYTVLLGYELIPGIFVFYNVITSIRLIIHLYSKQKKVSRALKEASHETRQLLAASSNNNNSDMGAKPRRGSLSLKETNQLQAVRKVYRACIRIALYPLVPLWWWVAMAAFYWGQYPLNMTFRWHVNSFLHLTVIAWTTFGSVIIANFIVFATDPSVLRVFSELKKDIQSRFGRKKVSDFSATESQEPLNKQKLRSDGVIITEHTDVGTVHGDTSSLDSAELKDYQFDSGAIHQTPAMLEDGGSFTTAYSGLEDDAVIRRARAGQDMEGFYDNM